MILALTGCTAIQYIFVSMTTTLLVRMLTSTASFQSIIYVVTKYLKVRCVRFKGVYWQNVPKMEYNIQNCENVKMCF